VIFVVNDPPGMAIAAFSIMRKRLCVAVVFFLVCCLAAKFSPGLFRASAELEVSAGISIQAPADFYGPLAANGAWVQLGRYGRCWRPAGVTAGWRPYCHGYWEWTDCGWYWVSDEPWAWACYHYGSWVDDSNYGWVWVPGVEWAPAWVNWRTGGDYIGWAPCEPPGVVSDPAYFVFVHSGHFRDHIRPDNVVFNNTEVINQTREISSVAREQRKIGGRAQTVMVNNGPRLATVEKATGHKFSIVPVEKAYQSTTRPEGLQSGQKTPPGLPLEKTVSQTPLDRNNLQPSQRGTSLPNQVLPSTQHPKEVVPAGSVLHPKPTPVPQNQAPQAQPHPPPSDNGGSHNQGNN
jgi:hypothetical protein